MIKRISGSLDLETYEKWKKVMKLDGFNGFWTWVAWVMNRYCDDRERAA